MKKHFAPKNTKNVATLGNGLEIKISTVSGAGMGLFALTPFERNSYITYLHGERITRKEAIELRERGLDSHVRCIHYMGDCINGVTSKTIQHGDGCASICNDGRNSQVNNCYFDTRNNVVWLRASRDIEIGEELLCSYGMNYWKFNRN